MPSDYLIQPARPEQVASLPAIERECAGLFPPGLIPEERRDDVVPEAELAAAQQQGRLWVATTGDGAPVGFALLDRVGGDAVLVELDVLPGHGRRGIGRELVRRVVEQAQAAGHAHLYLTTFLTVPWNAPFYSRLGFVILREEETPAFLKKLLATEREHGFTDRVAMRLDLSPTTNGR